MAQVTVDPLRCDAMGRCAQVCPGAVFAMRPPDPALPFRVRLKVSLHGGRQAVVLHEGSCTACMMCVAVCSGQAISISPH